MVVHNFRTVDKTGYMLPVMAEKMVGNPQKLKTDLSITIQSLTLSWVEAQSFVHCWGCISQEGAGVPHRIEGQLDGLHYQHILQNVTVPSVWMLYPEVIIHLQQDHSSIHDYSSSLQNTHHSQRTDIHPTGGIRTHNLSRRGAVDRLATGTGKISHLLIENEK